MNAYKILGIPNNSTILDIKKAYFKLAKTYHPDKNKAPGSKQKFIIINNAYRHLRRIVEERQKYREIISKFEAEERLKRKERKYREIKKEAKKKSQLNLNRYNGS